MLTFSFIWLVLAVAVTVAAMKRSLAFTQAESEREPTGPGKTLVIFAAIYGFVLLAGFLYVSKFLISNV